MSSRHKAKVFFVSPFTEMWKFLFSWKDYDILTARALVMQYAHSLRLILHIMPSVELSVVYLQHGSSTTSVRINERWLHTFVMWVLTALKSCQLLFYMKEWTDKNVLSKLKTTPGIDAFLELEGRGYLPIRIGRTSIFIFRERVGVSYYFQYPIESVEEAISVCDFMRHATPYLNQVIEKKRQEKLLFKPQPHIDYDK